MNDYSDLRQEAQLAVLKDRAVSLDPLLLLKLIDDLIEKEEAIQDALEKIYEGVDTEETIGDVIGFLEGA